MLFRNPKSAIRNSIEFIFILCAWAFPLVVLVCFNLHWFGSVTGYDSTNESTGFSREWFVKNWPTMLTQLNSIALYFVWPLAVLGVVRMWGRQWKLAAVLSAWVVPATLVYIAYYWAPDGNSVSYMRFMLTILPGLVSAAVWFLTDLHAVETGASARPRLTALYGIVSLGTLGAVGGLVSVNGATPMLENDHRQNLVLAGVTTQARSAGVGDGAVVFADERVFHHIQFEMRDLRLYSPDVFNKASLTRMVQAAQSDPDAPQGLQPQRALTMGATVGPMTDLDLVRRQNQVMDEALNQGRKVFLIGPKKSIDDFGTKFLKRKKVEGNKPSEIAPTYTTTVLKTWDEISDLRRDRAQRWMIPNLRPARPTPARGVIWQILSITPPPPATQPATTQAAQ